MSKREHQAINSTGKPQQQTAGKMCERRQQAASEEGKRRSHAASTIGEKQYQGSGEANIKFQTDLAASNINGRKRQPETSLTIIADEGRPFQQRQRQERMTTCSGKQKANALSSSGGSKQIRHATKVTIMDNEEKGM